MGSLHETIYNEETLERISTLYSAVWNTDKDVFKQRLKKHMSYKGFKGHTIYLEDQEELAGFAYGYISSPGQYYHELLSQKFNFKEYSEWLTNCIEFVEVIVHPSYRNRGFGSMLIENILEGVDAHTAILTTQEDNQSARSLYEGLNWKLLKNDFYPAEKDKPYVIMGKKLR